MCAVKIGRLGKFDLNPRGELWCKDENRFGHKLLAKYGWSRGKGLGKKEDGIVENLKVRMKMGQTGVGWDEKIPIGIDYRECDAVLKDLSEKYQKPGEIKNEDTSLEKRSQQFKNRIHYQKFVRGKDISQYSEKDMSCIFLSREPEKQLESTSKESTVTNIESYTTGLISEECTPMFNSQLSVVDYFAMKMKNKTVSSLNALKESKSDEDSQSKTSVINKKRKHEFKSSKKGKRLKHESEFGILERNLLNEEEHILEASLKETCNENLVSEKQFQSTEESCHSESMKKKKKMNKAMKNFCNAFKAKQDTETCWQEEKKILKGNSIANKNFAFDCSQDKSFNSAKESNCIAGNDVIGSQRKKEKKACKKEKEGIGDVKISSISESDDSERKSAEESITENLKMEKQSPKDSKRHRNKTSNLKSCLKSLTNSKYSFKQKRSVSFCENVSYQVIENVLSHLNSDAFEANEKLFSCNDEDSIHREVLHEIECIEMNHIDDSINSYHSSEDDECNDVSFCENMTKLDEVEDNTVPECFKLPKSSSTNYDSWLETQRIAARMKVYKNMVKRMKKHPILRKTNLLEIKGYGNWGL